jgi:hypothetical protein
MKVVPLRGRDRRRPAAKNSTDRRQGGEARTSGGRESALDSDLQLRPGGHFPTTGKAKGVAPTLCPALERDRWGSRPCDMGG